MVAVVVAAMAMGGFVAGRAIWQYFVALNRIQYHEGMEAMSRWLDPLGRDQSQEIDPLRGLIEEQRRITGDAGLHEDLRALDELERILAPWHRQVEYHAAMVRKYRGVARYPWLPVEPDPPEPRLEPDPPEPRSIPSGAYGDSLLTRPVGLVRMPGAGAGDQ
jgi:hypothetical protein